jgi:hypothetical protein
MATFIQEQLICQQMSQQTGQQTGQWINCVCVCKCCASINVHVTADCPMLSKNRNKATFENLRKLVAARKVKRNNRWKGD